MKRPRLLLGALAIALGLTLSGSMLLARQGVVKTRDGKTIEGDIDEKPDQIVITLHGIHTVINRENIDGPVEYFDNVEDRYKAKVAALPKKPSAADHLALARWLLDVKAYDLSLKEIDEARKIDPNSADAQTLEQTVLGQRRIEKNRPAAGTGTGTGPGTATRPPAAGGDAGAPVAKRFLTPEDINVIRQVEWREKDTTVPRVTVAPDLRKRYVNLKALDPGRFAALTQPQQAYYILTDADAPAEMKHDIKITTDPQAILEYRRVIQPLVINNCATTGCHGGHSAGKLFLYNNNLDREEVSYTNFYILQWYQQTFGNKLYSMVDRTYPERSILAQFALHPDVSEMRHPELKGQTFRPIAVNKQAASYKAIVGWMKSLQSNDPNQPADKNGNHTAYYINFDVPTSSPQKPVEQDAPKTDAPQAPAPAASQGKNAGPAPGK